MSRIIEARAKPEHVEMTFTLDSSPVRQDGQTLLAIAIIARLIAAAKMVTIALSRTIWSRKTSSDVPSLGDFDE